MATEVMFFGQLTEITGSSRLAVADVRDTDALKEKLFQDYPSLSAAKFRIAVNNKIINDNTLISEDSKIAFMPPFSGG
ncbi:MAG TPA: MoaD/ThiS family protein [Chitinophagaceae bacterium]|nr:MoaD/ThiS family protein [Chitinophagaceae bacterium]